MGTGTGHGATKVFVNGDSWGEGTNGFVRLVFLLETLLPLENLAAFATLPFSNSSLITSKLQPPAITFFNS